MEKPRDCVPGLFCLFDLQMQERLLGRNPQNGQGVGGSLVDKAVGYGHLRFQGNNLLRIVKAVHGAGRVT